MKILGWAALDPQLTWDQRNQQLWSQCVDLAQAMFGKYSDSWNLIFKVICHRQGVAGSQFNLNYCAGILTAQVAALKKHAPFTTHVIGAEGGGMVVLPASGIEQAVVQVTKEVAKVAVLGEALLLNSPSPVQLVS